MKQKTHFNVSCLYVIAIRLLCLALISAFADGLFSFSNSLSGNMDGFRELDHFVGITAHTCWTECGRHMSCVHAAYERRYQLCLLLEGPDTPPSMEPGYVVASKSSGTIVVSACCLCILYKTNSIITYFFSDRLYNS